VEWLLGGTSAERHSFLATVFCTSLNGFAQRCASMPPRDVAAWANGIYYTLTEAMMRHDGVPIKYVGDGSLGFFAGNDHADRALRTAREARRLLEAEDLVITLHSGDVYLGTMGHPDYARPDIIGQTVNTAFLVMSWIAQSCRSGIGVTAAAWEHLCSTEGLVSRGQVAVSGVMDPITIYEPELG